jgi:cytochrome c-type biogenesis protein CcmE
MKKSHIIGLIIIGIAIFFIISTVGDASTYVAFKDARLMATEGNGSSIHVVGKLVKGSDGQALGLKYDPKVDPNSIEFLMTDTLNAQERVILNQPKPQDLEKSEMLVVVGKMNLEKKCFEADQVLLKCPSKYNNTELKGQASL